MHDRKVGVMVSAPTPADAVSEISDFEELGIDATWSTSPGAGHAITKMAAAGVATERILLGTAVVQTWLQHPVSMAHEAQVVASVAPGRFRLGIGPGHRQMMQRLLNADFRAPLGHLREYLQILKALLQQGDVDFEGEYYTARAELFEPVDVPVMASALQPRSFELCGAESDGAITYLCPPTYLRDVALPAMAKGAESAGRPVPPLIAHVPVCVHENTEEVYEAFSSQVSAYAKIPFYARMLEAAGFPDSQQTGWTREMMDAIVVCGDESAVEKKIDSLFQMGASEVMATVITGTHREGHISPTEKTVWRHEPVWGELAGAPTYRTLNLLARISTSSSTDYGADG